MMINEKEATKRLLYAIFKTPEERLKLNERAMLSNLKKCISNPKGFSFKDVTDIALKGLKIQENTAYEKMYQDIYSFTAYVDEEKKVVALKFEDGSISKVKCAEGDTFSVEAGISIAFTKHLIGTSNKDFKKILDNKIVYTNRKESKQPLKPDVKQLETSKNQDVKQEETPKTRKKAVKEKVSTGTSTLNK